MRLTQMIGLLILSQNVRVVHLMQGNLGFTPHHKNALGEYKSLMLYFFSLEDSNLIRTRG